MEAHTGFHARAYKGSGSGTDCARCHAEHRGPKFTFVPLDRNSFDHGAQTGFTLEGRHRQQKCESCHNAARIAPAARSEIKLKDLNRSFLGLRRECTACHQEPHQGQLGTDCLRCHTPDAWKPASKFSHSGTPFPLTGMHQQVPCEKCHARTAQPSNAAAAGNTGPNTLIFKGLPFSNGCQSCHADQHHGAFQDVKLGGRCERCHNTGGFKSNRPARDFDHSLTRFRLVGKHADLPCGKCHKGDNFKLPIAHELCKDCHQDPHKGQFASRAAGSDCSACHSPTGFNPPLFDREAHKSVFPLVGKHATLPCVKCHQPAGREARFKTGKRHCPECHAEPHGGQFASEPYNSKCDLCHTEAGFENTTFSVERHAQTRFPLVGRHAEVACDKCHKQIQAVAKAAPAMARASLPESSPGTTIVTAPPNALRQFRFASRSCNACHTDPHRFDAQVKLTCETCHTPQGWKAVGPFDHSTSPFKFEGAHREAVQAGACVKCHKPLETNGVTAGTAPVFSGTSTQCLSCHAETNPHGSQFSKPANRQRDCSSCHVPVAWNAGGFNHDSARFTLEGAHKDAACTKCHKEQKEADGKTIRIYRGTPDECLKCH